MNNLRDKIVWITGASSGIGEELAYAFAREGAFLVLSARNREKLEQVKAICLPVAAGCLTEPADLSDVGSLGALVERVVAQTGKVDVLVNNAGRSQRSLATETPLTIDRTIMELNFFSVIALTKLVLPYMVTNRSGHLVVTSSITGKFGSPLRTAYAASKHALQGYFESLRPELAGNNIRVTIVSPGFIHTNISVNAVTRDGTAYRQMDRGQASGMDPALCAAKIVKAVKQERRELLVGRKEISMVYIRRYIPVLYHWLIGKIKN